MNKTRFPVSVVAVVLVFVGLGIVREGVAVVRGLDYGFVGSSTTNDLVAMDLVGGSALGGGVDLLGGGSVFYPYDGTLTRAGNEVWTVGASGDALVVVDSATLAINERVELLPTGEYPVDVLFGEQGMVAYVAGRDSELITVVDVATYGVVGSFAIDSALVTAPDPGKMVLNHCSGLLYVADWYDDYLFMIDPLTGLMVEEVDLGTSLWDVRIDPTATTLYVTDRGTNEVHVVEADSLALVTSVAVGDDPWGIDITPDGRFVFVANEDDGTVSVIDTGSNVVVETVVLPAGADPRDVEISEDGLLAYVPSGDVSSVDAVYVIDVATQVLVDTIMMPAGEGSNPNVVAIAPDFASLDPTTSFTSTAPAPLGTAVQFFDTTGNNPTTWLWDFGDGVGNSTDPNPTYAYTQAGTYTVTFTASNACGTMVYQDTVTVLGVLYLPIIHQ